MFKKEGFRQAVKGAAFTAIFLIALVMLTYMLRTNGPLKDRFVGFYAEPKNSVDVNRIMDIIQAAKSGLPLLCCAAAVRRDRHCHVSARHESPTAGGTTVSG